MFIKFYLLTWLGGHNTTRARIMNTSQIEQVVSSVICKMGTTRCVSEACSTSNSDNAYYGRIELDSHADTTVLGCNCVILSYTGKDCKVSPYSDEYKSIQHGPVVIGAAVWNCPQSGEKIYPRVQ